MLGNVLLAPTKIVLRRQVAHAFSSKSFGPACKQLRAQLFGDQDSQKQKSKTPVCFTPPNPKATARADNTMARVWRARQTQAHGPQAPKMTDEEKAELLDLRKELNPYS